MTTLDIPSMIMDYIIDDFKKVSWEKEDNKVKNKINIIIKNYYI